MLEFQNGNVILSSFKNIIMSRGKFVVEKVIQNSSVWCWKKGSVGILHE
jgi:hypothetical protein